MEVALWIVAGIAALYLVARFGFGWLITYMQRPKRRG
jgi:hypothetical protein